MDFAVTFKQLLPNFAPLFFKDQNDTNTYKVLVAQLCLTPCNPMDCGLQTSLFMEFSRQEYWSGLPFPLQGIFLTQGSNLVSCITGGFLPPGPARYIHTYKVPQHYLPWPPSLST